MSTIILISQNDAIELKNDFIEILLEKEKYFKNPNELKMLEFLAYFYK